MASHTTGRRPDRAGQKGAGMMWHLRAMWDALFDWPIWASLFGCWAAAGLGFWIGTWAVGFAVVMAVNGIWLPIFAWLLQYRLICKYRPIGEHYSKIETPYATYTYSDWDR